MKILDIDCFVSSQSRFPFAGINIGLLRPHDRIANHYSTGRLLLLLVRCLSSRLVAHGRVICPGLWASQAKSLAWHNLDLCHFSGANDASRGGCLSPQVLQGIPILDVDVPRDIELTPRVVQENRTRRNLPLTCACLLGDYLNDSQIDAGDRLKLRLIWLRWWRPKGSEVRRELRDTAV